MRVVRAKTVWRVLAGAAALCIHTGRFISRNPAFMLPRQIRCKVVGRFETSCIGVTLLRPCTLAKACRGGSLIPAWTLLERRSIAALLTPEPRLPNAIQVSSAVSPDEIAAAPIMRAIRLMVERVVASDGLMLTARGSLTRADISALFEAMDWPDYDKDSVLAVNKVLNEADVLPIQFTRIVAQETKLLRPRKGRLLATKRVRDLLSPERAADLFRSLLEAAFWRINLGYFDRFPIEHWPQTHIGVVLWSLSVAAHRWTKPEALLAACTMPDESFAGAAKDVPGIAMVTRVLRPLTWFGLMECMEPADRPKPAWGSLRLYRKSRLFDRLLSFDVQTRMPSGPLQ